MGVFSVHEFVHLHVVSCMLEFIKVNIYYFLCIFASV